MTHRSGRRAHSVPTRHEVAPSEHRTEDCAEDRLPGETRPVRRSSKWRLLLLLAALIGLSWVAYQRFEQSRAWSRVQDAIEVRDGHRALAEVESLENRFGRSGESCLLSARAFRHLGDRSGFARQIDLAKQYQADAKRIRIEELLFEAQRGTLPDVESQMGTLMQEAPYDFEEIAQALVYGLLGRQQVGKAMEFLLLWEHQSPGSPAIPVFRGMEAISRRDWKRAKELLEPAIREHADYVPIPRLLGIAYSGLNENESAAQAFDRYLSKVPEDQDAVLKYAMVLKKLGNSEEALAQLDRLVRSGNRSTDVRVQAAKIHLEQNASQKAIELLAETSRLWPEDVVVASTLSQAYQQLGDEPMAERLAAIADRGQQDIAKLDGMTMKLVTSPVKTAEECYALGHLLMHKQSRENGIYWLEAALAIDENFAPAHQDLVHYYTQTNQPQYAKVHQRYLDRSGAPP